MLGGFTMILTVFLTTIASLVPLLYGMSNIKRADGFGGVAILALVVFVAQLVFGFIASFLSLGTAAIAMIGMIFEFSNFALMLQFVFSGLLGYLNTFGIL